MQEQTGFSSHAADATLVMTGVTTVIIVTDAVIRMTSWLRQRRCIAKAKRQHIENLFGFIQDADFTTGRVPPDDVDSLKLFNTWLHRYFRKERRLEYRDDVGVPNISKHLCTIGGPVDHIFARYSMGYDNKAQRWKGILPFIFPLSDVEARQTTIIREWKGHRWKVPGWYIADRDGRPQFFPETDREGVLRKDYFMLIVAPNTFTRNAFYTGQKHMIIAPTHGLSQLAVKDILDNDDILNELSVVRQQSEYFQAIIEVPARKGKHGYAPTGNFLVRASEPLDVADFRTIAKFQDWA
jgi:hypothetical protein